MPRRPTKITLLDAAEWGLHFSELGQSMVRASSDVRIASSSSRKVQPPTLPPAFGTFGYLRRLRQKNCRPLQGWD